jgi:hypothetical protein
VSVIELYICAVGLQEEMYLLLFPSVWAISPSLIRSQLAIIQVPRMWVSLVAGTAYVIKGI